MTIRTVSAAALADALDRLAQAIDDQGRLTIVHNPYLCEGKPENYVEPRDARTSASYRDHANRLRAEGMKAWTYKHRNAHGRYTGWGSDNVVSREHRAYLSTVYAHDGETYTVSESYSHSDPQEFAGHDRSGKIRPGKYQVVENSHGEKCAVVTWDGKDGWYGTNTRVTPFVGEKILITVRTLDWYAEKAQREAA